MLGAITATQTGNTVQTASTTTVTLAGLEIYPDDDTGSPKMRRLVKIAPMAATDGATTITT